MDAVVLKRFDDSLRRCNTQPQFLDRFYELFLASSPKVRMKFADTDFVRQKRALRASLHMMVLAAGDGAAGADRHLRDLADVHSSRRLKIGAELYDLWLDSLLGAVREFDPEYGPEVEEAWEKVMMVGISYMLEHYH